MKSLRNYLPLLIVIILAAALRLYNLSNIPISLNTDELAIGYNSYSLLTTGKDEWGKTFPLSLKSFGDWKVPVYPLVAMVPIKVLGLNEFSVRLPSAVAGILSVLMMYLISMHIFKKRPIAILCALFMAISPWSIFFSRGAFEPNLALSFLLVGVYLFLRFTENNKFYLFLSSTIFFALTIFTYHGYGVFMPLFYTALVAIYAKTIFKQKINIAPVVLLYAVFGLFLFSTAISGSIDKLNSLSVYNDADIIYNRADKFLGDKALDNGLLGKTIYNRFTAAGYQLGENYLESFSPTFLFDKGGVKLFYNISGFGFMYLTDAFLIITGLAFLFWKREKVLPIIIVWLLLAPVPLAITREVPDPTRLMAVLPIFIFAMGYGAYSFYEFVVTRKNYFLMLVGIGFIFVYLYNIVLFMDLYFKHMDIHNAAFFHYGYKQAVEVANMYPNDKIVMVGPDNFPYISFLFYEKYDPNKFREEVKYYPASDSKFALVKSFGRYTFVPSIDTSNLEPNTLYINNANAGDSNNVIRLPNGDPLFTYFEGK